jgi:hypothetical protein
LGLTLYGSPKYLFILYALWGFFLLTVYFILSFKFRPPTGRFAPSETYEDASSYYTGYGTELTEDRRHHRRRPGLGALAAAGAAGAGLAALRRRSRSRSRPRAGRHGIHSQTNSRHTNGSVVEEKFAEDEQHPRSHTWRDRLLGVTAGVGALAAVRSLFNRRKGGEHESEAGSYMPSAAGENSVTQTDISRVEEGLAPTSPESREHWRRVEEREAAQAAAGASLGSPSRRQGIRRRSGGSLHSYSESSFSVSPRRGGFGIKEGIETLGLAGFLRSKFKARRKRKEDTRVEEMRRQEIENERIARMNSQRRRYTGDGTPRRGGRSGSITDSEALHGSTPEISRHNIPAPPGPLPDPATIPPPPIGALRHESGSDSYISPSGQHRRRHHLGEDVAAGTAAAAAAERLSARRDTSQQRSSGNASLNSQPVSVKLKMHNDGRHVTLRRLNEEEAEAEREARRKERRRRDRNGSLSSVGEDVGGYRRTDPGQTVVAESSQAAASRAANPAPVPMPVPTPLPHDSQTTFTLPPPPPIPAATGSVGTPPPGATPYDTGTEMSRPSTYDSNRRRRRAERAQRAQMKGSGSRVEFT